MRKSLTTIDREARDRARYVFIQIGDETTDIVNDETGEVIYETRTTRGALERAAGFATRHHYTVRYVWIIPRENDPEMGRRILTRLAPAS